MRLLKPLRKNSVRAALVTLVVAYGAEFGLNVDPTMGQTVLAVLVSTALGHIADRRKKAGEEGAADVPFKPAATEEDDL